tara:strand:- start:74 stop:583 length:510 start_codon:yes stop_codon:yes gene_type:complete
MVKKILGYGILVIILFFLAITFIPSSFSPSVSMQMKSDRYTIQRVLSDIHQFRLWDPKAISDPTVTYSYSIKKNTPFIEVTDSLDIIIATYKIEKSTLDEVHISVNLNNLEPLLYKFKLTSEGQSTLVTWNMKFDGNLMMLLFGVEGKLEETFLGGLEKLNALVNKKYF